MQAQATAVNDMLVIVKSREFQRAMFAEAQNDKPGASRHFLATAHLELVLAEDYRAVGDEYRVVRSLISAASCFWRGGQPEQGEFVFERIAREYPKETATVQELREELLRDYPPQAA